MQRFLLCSLPGVFLFFGHSMKFKMWDGREVEVWTIEVQRHLLKNRQCTDCFLTRRPDDRFFEVVILPPIPNSRNELQNRFAMCEGCKKIVELA